MGESGRAKDGILSHLKQDIPASIVLLFVALPLCLGIALASGAPLFAGLIAGILGGVLVGALSGSRLGVSGPAAGLAVVVFEALQTTPFETFLLAVVIGGVLQIMLGLVRAGIIGYFFPSSAIKGMLAGIGIIIIIKQIPHAFAEVGIAFISVVILLLWELYLMKKHKVFTLIQGPIVVVAVGICCQLIAPVDPEHLVSVPVASGISSFFSQFTFPDIHGLFHKEVYVLGVTIAIVASLETLLCVEATDKQDPHKRVTPTNRELFAQGTGNIVSGMIGGLPITQVIVRSSANMQAGAQSKLSAIFHGLFLLICVALLPSVLNLIPLSALACILIMVGYKLAKPSLFVQTYKLGWDQFLPFVVTIFGIIFVDLLVGLGIGVCVGTAVVLLRNYKNSHFLHMKFDKDGKHLRMTLAEDVNFLNKGAIVKEFDKIPEGVILTIDLRKCYSIDYDVREAIEDFIKTAGDRDIKVKLEKPLNEARNNKNHSKGLDKWILALPVENKTQPV
ncbi:sulfate permease and related transporters [Candidatus Scalindua japonica]|uniref:Sulfate permease and related transporters n=1 Tax=Candidatus Scalindua japonica TaxID=1284222 RepID=A0A286U017_9BACT|nr:SulP family inorganic anion transporter [Candidatus Scalindua japonica]GAX61485.1 sulfate permease and related transporters [Candidatus Scalindua japonica]